MEAHAGSKPGNYGTLKEPAELSVMRVNQLDAGVLDTELHSLLKTQLGRACTGLPAGTLERFKPEVCMPTYVKGAMGASQATLTPLPLTLSVIYYDMYLGCWWFVVLMPAVDCSDIRSSSA